MDNKIEISGRAIDKPFFMAVESYNKKFKAQAIGIETFNKTLDYG